MKLILVATALFVSQFSFAAGQKSYEQALAEYQQAKQAKIERMAAQFAASHGGFQSGLEATSPRMTTAHSGGGPGGVETINNNLYKFTTGNNDECVITQQYYEDNNTGPDGQMRLGLHCTNGATGRATANVVKRLKYQ